MGRRYTAVESRIAGYAMEEEEKLRKINFSNLKKNCRDEAVNYALELYNLGKLKSTSDDVAIDKITEKVKDIFKNSRFNSKEDFKALLEVAIDSYVRAKYRIFNAPAEMTKNDPMNPNKTRK